MGGGEDFGGGKREDAPFATLFDAKTSRRSRRRGAIRPAFRLGGVRTESYAFKTESYFLDWRTQRHRRTRSLPHHRDKTHRVREEENVHGCCEDAGRRA